MSEPPILSYSEVVAESGGNRHLLLGNGFSIACRPDVFRYDSLFNRADFSKLARVRDAFTALDTTNFETVIRACGATGRLAGLDTIYVVSRLATGYVAAGRYCKSLRKFC